MNATIERLEQEVRDLKAKLAAALHSEPCASVSSAAPPPGTFAHYRATAMDILAKHTFGMKF